MNPYSEILKLTETEQKEGNSVITTGEVISVNPLKVRVGELEYETEDLKFLSHVTIPTQPEDIGTLLFIVTLDGRQTFYVIGKI